MPAQPWLSYKRHATGCASAGRAETQKGSDPAKIEALCRPRRGATAGVRGDTNPKAAKPARRSGFRRLRAHAIPTGARKPLRRVSVKSSIPPIGSRARAVADFRRLIVRHASLTVRQKVVALALIDALSLRKWACAPSYAQLARWIGCTERTIGRALRVLHGLNLFRWRRRYRKPSEYAPNMALVDGQCLPPSGRYDAPRCVGDCGPWQHPPVRMVAAVWQEPSRACEAKALDGGPPVLGRLSSAILATFAGRSA